MDKTYTLPDGRAWVDLKGEAERSGTKVKLGLIKEILNLDEGTFVVDAITEAQDAGGGLVHDEVFLYLRIPM